MRDCVIANEKRPYSLKGLFMEERVLKTIAEHLQVPFEELDRDKSFTEDLQADSLDIVEMVMGFEDEFNINISDEDYEKMLTVGAAIDYIEEKCKAKSEK